MHFIKLTLYHHSVHQKTLDLIILTSEYSLTEVSNLGTKQLMYRYYYALLFFLVKESCHRVFFFYSHSYTVMKDKDFE